MGSVRFLAPDTNTVASRTARRQLSRMISADDECVAVSICEILRHSCSLVDIVAVVIKPSQHAWTDGGGKNYSHTPVGGVRYGFMHKTRQEAGALVGI